jgi:hypothetical protein
VLAAGIGIELYTDITGRNITWLNVYLEKCCPSCVSECMERDTFRPWNLWEGQTIKFTWEVFNVTNSVRFDTSPNSLGNNLTTSSLGIYNALLTVPRVRQFSLRYAF